MCLSSRILVAKKRVIELIFILAIVINRKVKKTKTSFFAYN